MTPVKKMKNFLLLVLPLALSLSACATLQPMFDKAWDGIDKVFDSPDPAPQAASGTTPRASYDQSAVACYQEASQPYSSVDFNFCMRTRGYEVVAPRSPH